MALVLCKSVTSKPIILLFFQLRTLFLNILEDVDNNDLGLSGTINALLQVYPIYFYSTSKLPFRLDLNNRVARRVVDIIGKRDVQFIKDNYKTLIGFHYKIELADTKLGILLKELLGILRELSMHEYYVLEPFC